MSNGNREAQARYNGPPAGPAPRRLPDFGRRVVVAVLISLLLIGVACLFVAGMNVFLQAFGGLLFAVFLSALADWLSRHTRLSYGWALAVVVTVLILLAGGFGYLLWNRLSGEAAALTTKLPASLSKIKEYLKQYAWGNYLLQQVPGAASSLAQAGEFSRITGLISGVASFLITVVVVIFVGIFGAAEPRLYREGLLLLVPPHHRPRVREALEALAVNLRWWLLGQVCLMIIIWITTTLGLWLIGVDLALTLGLIAGVFEMVPYVGPWLSAIPAALVALLLSPWHLLGVLGLYLALHIMEGYLLLPLIQRRAVLMPPALTLVAQVLLGEILGLMGLFVAAPLTVSGVVLLKMLYIEDTLGDQTVDVPGEPGNEVKPAAEENRAQRGDG
jgi:predicted PurR-regulated permease PerM